MEAVRLPGTDLDVSMLVLGGNMLGSRLDRDSSFAVLDAYAQAGGSMIDTAAVYADWLPDTEAGCSERTIGRWLRARPSSPMLVTTKGGHPDLSRPHQPRLDGPSLRHDVEQSLERMGLDRLALWFTHRDDPALSVQEIIESVEALRDEGLLRWYGVSNWSTSRVAQVLEMRSAGAAPGFVATQAAFAAAAPRPDGWAADLTAADGPMLDLHQASHLTLFAYSAQAKGWFDGAVGATDTYDTPANRHARDVVRSVAAEAGVEPGQVALAALLELDLPLRLVVGCSTPARLRQSAGALALRLTPEQSRRVQGVLPAVPGVRTASARP
ncbi:MAG: aldo/keto reductase [Lapillicoccus sp.]